MRRGALTSLLWLILACVVGALPALAKAHKPSREEKAHVLAAARKLAEHYNKETGLFDGTGWWNSANGITALANAGRVLKTNEFDPIFENTFTQAQKKSAGFLNEFYDDEGWWALAWLDVYQLHGGERYGAMSRSIFDDMTTGWSDACGGGIWWKKNERYKNAIANELFLSVATRLAAVSSGEAKAKYLDWAKREEGWFAGSGMINGQGLVNDGLNASCENNGKTTWTYNQGVLLTGFSEYAKLSGLPEPLAMAHKTALAVKAHIADGNGVVHDPCEPECGADGIQFKGILMRNLAALDHAAPSAEVEALMQSNAESVWTKARTAEGMFSVNWAGPPRDSGTGALISATDALTAPLLAAAK